MAHATSAALQPLYDDLKKIELEPASIDGELEKLRWPYILALVPMWILIFWVGVKKYIFRTLQKNITTNSFWVDGISPASRVIKENAGNWRSLDVVYNPSNTNSWIDRFWLNIRNAQAVRNRKRIVTIFLVESFSKLARKEHDLKLLSVASGSAQAVIEALARLRKRGIEVVTYLYDNDESALANALKLAEKHGVSDLIHCILEDVLNLRKVVRQIPKCHVVEMVGLLDYFQAESAGKLIRIFRNCLRKDGVFLTATINYNVERWFLQTVVNWRMVYRTKEEFAQIVHNAGFEKLNFLHEPFGIHHMVAAQT